MTCLKWLFKVTRLLKVACCMEFNIVRQQLGVVLRCAGTM